MPSFFFHIALDLYKAPSSNTYRLVRGTDIFHLPRQESPKQTIKSEKEVLQSLAATQDHNQRDLRTVGLDTVELHLKRINATTHQPGKGEEDTSESKASSLGAHDWRYDEIAVQSIDMAQVGEGEKHDHINNGIGAAQGGLATKGRYEPLDLEQDDLGWGIVRLYRDAEETPGLYDDDSLNKGSKSGRGSLRKRNGQDPTFRDEDCTTLCILAVPSYLTPSDFLGFVGEKTRDEVSHFRMIRTERGNRYMVLMKFRNGKKARQWRKEWNGKAFDGMEVWLYFDFKRMCMY